MDAVRQSALAGALMGFGVAALGILVAAIGLGIVPATLHAPGWVVTCAGAGLVLAGAAFAVATWRLRLALLLAIPGMALAFFVPMAWFAMPRHARSCTVQLLGGGASSPAIPLSSSTCGWVLAAVLLLVGLVIGAMAFAWNRTRR